MTISTRKMTTHTLDASKGWPQPHAVDFVAKLSANVTIDPVFAGRCVHLNSSGEYEMGLPNTVGACNMAMFLFQSSDEPDVMQNAGGTPSTDEDAYVTVTPKGGIMAIPAKAAVELFSTEFESEASVGSTYEAGDPLTATPDNTNATTGGRITKSGVTAYGTALCGVVSRGVVSNSHKKNAIAFWPVFLPRQA